MTQRQATPNHLLLQERIRRHWSQRELAARLDTSFVNVSRWERGITTPGPYFRQHLCALFEKTPEELGLVPDQRHEQQYRKLEASQAALWHVPYPRNPHFTGRNELLEQLDRHFSSRHQNIQGNTSLVALTQPQAIKGLGGIGKTQIAVEYAYRAREQGRYIYTFWINAAGEEAIITSFTAVAELLPAFPEKEQKDQAKLVEAVKRWLEERQEPWLLIFDNADNIALAQRYFPTTGKGSILLTTRAHAVGSLAVSVEVEKMGLIEGAQLLLRRARCLHPTDEEHNDAANVVIALDSFPLALDQTGAYIEETGCSFSDYLQLYQKHRKALLDRRGAQATNYPDSVVTTWALSFHKIEQKNPAAAELLHLCAFLAPDAIPEELLKEGAPYWTPALQHAASDLFTFNQILEELLAFSLVKRLAENQTVSIHRLVQAVQVDAMEPEEQRQWAERVVRAVDALFPRDPGKNTTTWPQCLRYLEQVQACDTLIQRYHVASIEAADLFHRTGLYLREHASYSLAEIVFLRALSIQESLLGTDHLDIATTLNNLAILYLYWAKYAQAEPLYLRALAIQEHLLGTEHPDVASSLNELAVFYRHVGKYSQVEPLYQRALAIQKRHLGTDHLDTAATLNNLAALYRYQGKYAQAEPLFQQALAIRERALGTEHLDVASCLNNLAALYRSQGKYTQAEPLFQQALAIKRRLLGPEHPTTALSLNDLANVYREQGQYEQAEPLYQQALAIYKQQMGDTHPFTAVSLNNLANVYREQGKLKQAEPLFQQALAIRESQLKEDHPLIASSLNSLATLYRDQKKYKKAEQLYRRALSIREHQLGLEHLDTAATLHNLAQCLEAQEKYQIALPLYRRALEIREKVLGYDHQKTVVTRTRYTELLQAIEPDKQ